MSIEQMSIEDKARGYVLGSLSPEEREGVTRERLYNAQLDGEIILVEQLYAGLVPDQEPDVAKSDVWDRISDAIEEEKSALAGKYAEDCSSGEWQEHGHLIEFKTLWSDKAVLIRCNPGAVEEAHDQPADDDEHILIVAGDLNVGGRIFGTGDYIRVPAGVRHQRMTTQNGCILFTEYVAAG